jgi:uncharacterized membrane protein
MPWIDWFMTQEGHHLPRHVSRWIIVFGRFGFISRGLIYFSMGLLATMATLGLGGDLTDAQGAMQAIDELPLGFALVIFIAIGLSGYALWRIVQAVFNLENYDNSTIARTWRCYFILDGLFHAGFAVFVIMALAGGAAEDGEATREWTAKLMRQPAGRWFVGILGGVTILSGLYLFFRAWSTRFREHWEAEHIPMMAVHGAAIAARVGEVARGVVFVLIGLFIVRAALAFDPEEARGLGESLQILAQQPFGRIWLGAIAIGFMLYGVYSVVDGFYRRIGRGLSEQQEGH